MLGLHFWKYRSILVLIPLSASASSVGSMPSRVMKYVHFSRNWYPDVPVFSAASEFYELVEGTVFGGEAVELLLWYRGRGHY